VSTSLVVPNFARARGVGGTTSGATSGPLRIFRIKILSAIATMRADRIDAFIGDRHETLLHALADYLEKPTRRRLIVCGQPDEREPLAGAPLISNVRRLVVQRLSLLTVRFWPRSAQLAVRSLLHALGYRFRLHRRDLPGTPDIVLSGRRCAIFVHGCFWHAHGCRIGQPPKSRLDYWRPKLEANKARDLRKLTELEAAGVPRSEVQTSFPIQRLVNR
jgi:DNA mismatch endonuclease (patch repair protein)